MRDSLLYSVFLVVSIIFDVQPCADDPNHRALRPEVFRCTPGVALSASVFLAWKASQHLGD